MKNKTVSIPFQDKGHMVSYTVETIDVGHVDLQFINVYTVFPHDQELIRILGDHFTILHNLVQIPTPVFTFHPGNIEEMNLKKRIAQQILNNPTE